MEANPDLPGAEVDRWLSHLKHHLRRYAKEKESKVEVRPLVAVTCASIVDGLVIGPALADSDLKCPDGEAEANNLHVATIDEVTTNPEREDILHSTSSSNWDIPQCQTSSIYCPLVDSFRNDGARHSTITALPPDTSLTRKTISLVGFKVNLLGRDLLIATCPLIKCSPDGLILEFPDGNTYCCSAASASGATSQFPLVEQRPVACATADIYWARVDIDSGGWLEAEHFWTLW
ncbi:uncharacterized protein LOC133511370 isoform X3 [Syngnathoides biaculeatus]|uniref:uncharacterized protein LOC133511370 isoform X3 n=1 Tax=Syngnathoides biaculeatus TaxID=300417 RepID=UPI002ADDD8FE|nr:uncharacterized protein LOC133511370 isoform X3 [Syngnathoides biaculeatus]